MTEFFISPRTKEDTNDKSPANVLQRRLYKQNNGGDGQ